MQHAMIVIETESTSSCMEFNLVNTYKFKKSKKKTNYPLSYIIFYGNTHLKKRRLQELWHTTYGGGYLIKNILICGYRKWLRQLDTCLLSHVKWLWQRIRYIDVLTWIWFFLLLLFLILQTHEQYLLLSYTYISFHY